MNKIFFTALCFFATITSAICQTFKATIRPGSTANSLIVAIRPSGAFVGKPSNVQFSIAVPQTVGARPTMSFMTNNYSTLFTTVNTFQTASFATDYIYGVDMITPTLTTDKSYTANTEDIVAEVSFAGNVGNISNIRLIQVPNGMTTTGAGSENGNYNYYIDFANGGDKTDQAAMFYTTTGGTVLNSPLGYSGLSSVSAGSAVFPLKWLSFSAQRQNNSAVLRWEVANQLNNDYYEVEAGSNPQTLAVIGKVSATDQAGVYTFTDINLYKMTGQYAYYRIKQVDKDGKFTYSEVKKIAISGKEFSFGIVNNPVKGRELKIKIQSGENSKGLIKIFDLNGKQVYQNNVNWAIGYSEQIVQLPNLAAGSYVATLVSGTETYQAKFVK